MQTIIITKTGYIYNSAVGL